MSPERLFRDGDGNVCSLDALVRREPGWAASRIRVMRDMREEPLTAADAMTVPGVRELVEYLYAELTRCGWFVSAAFKRMTLDKIAPLLAAMKGGR